MKKLVMTMLLGFAVALAGCAAKKPVDAAKEETPAAGPPAAGAKAPESSPADKIVPPGEARTGDKTVCPVMREHDFVVQADSPKVEYKGKTYYFCCEECIDTFKAEPEKYIQ
ncbi:MAG: hypothetical protein GMKNLPBB_01551 [Myxococcota bacterium]|nr:hypothetical protein [Myxococcota bacterium]